MLGPLSSRPGVRQRLLHRVLWFPGLATSSQTARDVLSCFRGRPALKHLHKKRRSVSTQRERLKPSFVVGRSLGLKQGVSCAILMACGFQRVPCSPNRRYLRCSQNPPQESPETRGFFEAVKFPLPHHAWPKSSYKVGGVIEYAGPPTRGSDPKRGSSSHPSIGMRNSVSAI